MNDRFKFRVWCENNKEWETDEICISNKDHYIINQKLFSKDEPKHHIINFCTSLKDKNGKLIYEGDIIEIDTNYNGTVRGKVYYDEQDIQIKIMLYYQQNFSELYANRDLKYFYDKYLIKVIGNIYENKELLE